ncbi:MAG: energy transducer TonB [Chromatiales bacterium]|jgi:protein TonB|nr:energy transducer TonB [Chromatiales bacterium]MDH3947066.1 energy transducer TonB [Chromatiales bacterium]MDH4013610.1 energy transducer TonB [Chromatiales bacterium]PLX55024.1 MAG: protein TonB [Chromatiales bacterium]
MVILRYLFVIAIAAAINWGLLFLMQALIAAGKSELNDESTMHFVDFVRVEREEQIERKKPKPKKPIEPDQPPPDMPQQQQDALNPEAGAISIAPVAVSADIDIGGIGLGSADGDYLPIVKVAPIYPRRALSRGIEGWVLLEFTVTRAGTVTDVRVLESEPPGIFDKAASEAASKFKYKPRVVDGEPIDVKGVPHKISFQLED